jgi:hypothetical protein
VEAEARDLQVKKEVVFLSDLRAFLELQLAHFRRCAAVLEGVTPLITQLEEHARTRAKELEDAQATRRQMAERRAADALQGRFAPLVEMAASPGMELVSSVADTLPQEASEQLVASVARVLDAQPGHVPLRIIRDAITE